MKYYVNESGVVIMPGAKTIEDYAALAAAKKKGA